MGIPLDCHDHFVDLVSCSLSPRISRFCGKNGIICVTAFCNDYHCRDVFSFKISGWRQQVGGFNSFSQNMLVKMGSIARNFRGVQFPPKNFELPPPSKGKSYKKPRDSLEVYIHHAYPPNRLEVFPFSHLPGHGLLNYQPAMAHMGAIGW